MTAHNSDNMGSTNEQQHAIPTGLHFLRKHWLLVLQGMLSILLLWRIFSDPTLREEVSLLAGDADRSWLLAGLGAALVSELLCAARWWIMLQVFGVPVGFARCCAFTGAGLFYSFMLPGAGGGDAFRILYVVRLYPGRKMRAAMSVIADRLCGMVALLLALGLTLMHHRHFPLQTHARTILEASVGVLGITAIAVCLWWLTTIPAVKVRGLRFLPAAIRGPINDLGENFWQIVNHPRQIAIGVVFSCGALAAHFITYYCSARAFGLSVTLGQMFAVMPVIDALIMLPVTFYGVGLRETLFEHLLGGMYGIPRSAATVASLGGFGLQAIVGVLGGLLIPFTVPAVQKSSKK